MKKFHLNPRSWKLKKRHSFHLYFILFAMLLVAVSALIPSAVYAIVDNVLDKRIVIPEIIIIAASSFLVGTILSFFIGKILLKPVKKLQLKMNEVANGNFDVFIEENNIFDEVEDMYHYFNMMVKELRSTETIQSDFISNVSHEFKTPLTAIEGYATLLNDSNITEEEKNLYVEKILFNLRRMNELVNNVLLLSKVDNQSIERNATKYLLDEQIRQSILYMEPKWSNKNIEFEINLEKTDFYGNESLMFHVWNNLLSNAIKFSPDGGSIRINLSRNKKHIVYVIENDGPNISETEIEHLFNKFYQGDTSHKMEGYGLGLALVQKILDISNGYIEVDNLYPVGCRFTVYLPNRRKAD